MARPGEYRPAWNEKARKYIKDCPDTIPSLAGLSIFMDVPKSTLEGYKYKEKPGLEKEYGDDFHEFRRLLDKMNTLQELVCINDSAKNTINANIGKLVLAKHGYCDKQDITHHAQDLPTITINMPKPSVDKD